jgi:hypothetical protein
MPSFQFVIISTLIQREPRKVIDGQKITTDPRIQPMQESRFQPNQLDRIPPFQFVTIVGTESILTEESDANSQKHFSFKTSTDEGIVISIKPVALNASIAICDNFETDSILTEESDQHSEKQFVPGNVTESEIAVRCSSSLI